MAAQRLQSLLSSPTHDLPMFHDGSPYHTHQKCSHCFQVQRSHQAKLSLCAMCRVEMYCSKECQKAHWPAHKAQCKVYKAERLAVAEKTGIESAQADCHAWIKYFDTPIKNCAIAAMRLPETPHMERTEIFSLTIHHKGDPSRPVQQRFAVIEVARRRAAEFPPMSTVFQGMKSYPGFCERGKVEMGARFYGCVRVGILATYGPSVDEPVAVIQRLNHFSIDDTTARAKIVRQDWFMLFREYVEQGARIKFCCGRLPGAEDVCCCGGWVHDEEKRKAFSGTKN
ncbi:hypothetical protein MSAN_01955500 [Mycena sanguinolenta]|uniref:MYND-type domain-containing protein n=1 Tax=Mycena sanguinolenta TaxID=230812 RepID=A0A8H7CN03_9AGAR|nr:hypothetical protein MSAN_01955500 [Mycena sanguinolenta]